MFSYKGLGDKLKDVCEEQALEFNSGLPELGVENDRLKTTITILHQ